MGDKTIDDGARRIMIAIPQQYGRGVNEGDAQRDGVITLLRFSYRAAADLLCPVRFAPEPQRTAQDDERPNAMVVAKEIEPRFSGARGEIKPRFAMLLGETLIPDEVERASQRPVSDDARVNRANFDSGGEAAFGHLHRAVEIPDARQEYV